MSCLPFAPSFRVIGVESAGTFQALGAAICLQGAARRRRCQRRQREYQQTNGSHFGMEIITGIMMDTDLVDTATVKIEDTMGDLEKEFGVKNILMAK